MKYDLTEGHITKKLIKLSIPIMGTSLLATGYMTMDIFWISKLGPDYLAAVAAAGNIYWFLTGFLSLIAIGAQIGFGQSIGSKNSQESATFIKSSIVLSTLVGIVLMIFVQIFADQITSVFNLKENIHSLSVDYLRVFVLTFPTYFFHATVSGLYNGSGNSKTPFIVNTIGLVLNIVLDPIFIYKFNWGIRGAAWATFTADFIITVIFAFILGKDFREYIKIKSKNIFEIVTKMYKLGIPDCIKTIVFAGLTSVISRMMNDFNSVIYAAYQVGVQIESIGFISFNGFAVAISSFVSQNFGAKKMDRVIDGYIHGRRVSLCIALFVCILFTAFSKSIVSIFLEPSTQSYFLAVDYIRIIAFAQFFAAIEAAANGFFMGIGNTKVISFISIFGNSLKVPLSILFVYLFNENGFWYAIFVSMFVRGFLSFIFALRERKSINEMLYSGSDLNIC